MIELNPIVIFIDFVVVRAGRDSLFFRRLVGRCQRTRLWHTTSILVGLVFVFLGRID